MSSVKGLLIVNPRYSMSSVKRLLTVNPGIV